MIWIQCLNIRYYTRQKDLYSAVNVYYISPLNIKCIWGYHDFIMMGSKKEKEQIIEVDKYNSKSGHVNCSLFRLRRLGNICLVVLAVAALVFVLYSQILHAPFQYDDIKNIRDNPKIRITELSPGALFDAGFYSLASNRPVANISFAVNYYFQGYHVEGYHAVNILIHLITGLFLFLLVRDTVMIIKMRSLSHLVSDVVNPSVVAFSVALIWLVHPLNTQAVSYIVQRMTSMEAMFYILSMLSYVKGRVKQVGTFKWLMYGVSFFSGLLAMGSKEIAATLPFFILLYEWYFFHNMDTSWLKRHYPVLLALVAVGTVLGLNFLGWSPTKIILTGYSTRDFTLEQRVLTELRVIVMYIGLILLPYHGSLNLDYDFPLSYSLINPPTTLISMLVIIGLIGFAVYIARKDRLISFAIVWFFGNLLIESSVIPLEIVYEHRTYLPSMFLIVLAVILVNHYLRSRLLKIIALCCVIAVFSHWTYQRNLVWQNEITLWQDCVKKSPNKSRTHNNYGLALLKYGKVDEAVMQCRQAVKLSPNIPLVYNSLGTALLQKGKIDEAIIQYQNAINQDPNYVEAIMNMASAYDKKGNVQGAMHYYGIANNKDPQNVKALNGIGKALTSQKRYNEAINVFSQALAITPNSSEEYNNIGNVLLMQGKFEEARRQYRSAIQKKPDYAEAYLNLGISYVKQGRIHEGIRYLEKVVVISPDYERGHSTLASSYYKTFALDKAVQQFQEVLRINPKNLAAQKNLKGCIDLIVRLDSAILGMKEQLEADPGNAELHYMLGELLQHRGDQEAALVEFNKSLSVKRSPRALHKLAVIYAMKGDYARAIQFLEEMTTLKPDDPDVYYNLACSYSQLGRVDDALRSLRNALVKGFNKWDILKNDPDLENVRVTEGYKTMIQMR